MERAHCKMHLPMVRMRHALKWPKNWQNWWMLRIELALAKRINILIIGHGMERAYIYSMPHRLNILSMR